MRIKFNVFGKPMSVIREEQEWLLFQESDTGIRSRVYDVIIPSELGAEELGKYLDDIFHEFATEKHNTVLKIEE